MTLTTPSFAPTATSATPVQVADSQAVSKVSCECAHEPNKCELPAHHSPHQLFTLASFDQWLHITDEFCKLQKYRSPLTSRLERALGLQQKRWLSEPRNKSTHWCFRCDRGSVWATRVEASCPKHTLH